MSSVSPTNQDLSIDTTFSQIKSRVPVPLTGKVEPFFMFLHPLDSFVVPLPIFGAFSSDLANLQ